MLIYFFEIFVESVSCTDSYACKKTVCVFSRFHGLKSTLNSKELINLIHLNY